TRLVAVGEADAEVLAGGALEVLRVDASTGLIAGADAVDAAALPRIDPESPAYVFFTSGSTGIPKAVQGRHKGLAHFLGWQRSTFRVGPGDRASQLTALSFDVILRDVFLALTSGGTLCIPGEADALDPARILSWLRDQRITVVHVVPSLARLWLTHAPADARLPTLRWAFLAGEPLTDVLVNRFREKIGIEPTVVNLYGPTETTLAKCYHVVGREPEPGVQPIGRPLPQTQVLILNRRRRVCGVNETGEIAIRTPFRTFGYLNAPEANARAFIPNPFRDDPTDLVYLTGDSGRYRTDGLLEILGRIDNQVKIRGIRVEPGEIEATLGHHPDVREAVVVARDDGTGQKILVAYVVLKQRPKASGEAIARLRDFLRARLPEHMVPSAFMLLEALPLNPNGKVDKKSLPAPTDLESGVSTAYVAPSDDVGQRVARVFEAVMNIKRVGMNDEFFDLGGDSLRAMMLIVRIEQEFGTKLPLHTFWSNGTPAKIAALVRGEAQAQHGVLVTIQAGSPERAPVYWLPGGGGLSVMVFRRVSQLLGPDQPVYGLEADLDLARAPKTLQGLAASYIDAIKARQPSGPYHLLGFSLGTFTAYEMAVQLRRRGDTVGLLCLFDTPPGDVLNRAEKLAVAAQRAAYRIAELRRLPGRRVAEQVRRIARNVIGEMRGGNGVGVPDPALQTVVDQNRRAALDYMKGPLPRFDGDVTIVLANATSMAGVSPAIDPRLAWRKFCDGDVEVHRVPGNHLSMLEPPHVEELGETLRAIVERAQRQRAAP
ncbi:MAG TPA: AMP-binding protein, partial [Polyangiaceae bacterium]|nr:AMP-binding protein [Polyangiaceae bacterium]